MTTSGLYPCNRGRFAGSLAVIEVCKVERWPWRGRRGDRGGEGDQQTNILARQPQQTCQSLLLGNKPFDKEPTDKTFLRPNFSNRYPTPSGRQVERAKIGSNLYRRSQEHRFVLFCQDFEIK